MSHYDSASQLISTNALDITFLLNEWEKFDFNLRLQKFYFYFSFNHVRCIFCCYTCDIMFVVFSESDEFFSSFNSTKIVFLIICLKHCQLGSPLNFPFHLNIYFFPLNSIIDSHCEANFIHFFRPLYIEATAMIVKFSFTLN